MGQKCLRYTTENLPILSSMLLELLLGDAAGRWIRDFFTLKQDTQGSKGPPRGDASQLLDSPGVCNMLCIGFLSKQLLGPHDGAANYFFAPFLCEGFRGGM